MKKYSFVLIAVFCATFLFVSCNKQQTEKPLPPTPDTVNWPTDIKYESLNTFVTDIEQISSLTIKTVSAKEMQTIIDDPATILIGESGILCVYIKGGEATVATTAKRIIMSEISDLCYNLKNMTRLTGLEILDFSNTTSIFGLFMKCEKIQSLDLSSLNTTKVNDAGDLFEFCYKLNSIKLGSNFTLNNVKSENLRNMFWIDELELRNNPINIIDCPDSQKNTIKAAWVDCQRGKSALSFDGKPAFAE